MGASRCVGKSLMVWLCHDCVVGTDLMSVSVVITYGCVTCTYTQFSLCTCMDPMHRWVELLTSALAPSLQDYTFQLLYKIIQL